MRTQHWMAVAGVAICMACSGGRGFWYLSVINNGAAPVEVGVSLAKGAWTVAPGESKTVKIDGQQDADHGKERTFTLTTGGKTETLTAKVKHPDVMVLDVTGTGCVVAADYGPQYRGKEVPLPSGEGDLRVLKVFQGERLYAVGKFTTKKSPDGTFITTNIGEKLPEQIKRSAGSTDIPEHLRLVLVPCNSVHQAEALYTYLNEH